MRCHAKAKSKYKIEVRYQPKMLHVFSPQLANAHAIKRTEKSKELSTHTSARWCAPSTHLQLQYKLNDARNKEAKKRKKECGRKEAATEAKCYKLGANQS